MSSSAVVSCHATHVERHVYIITDFCRYLVFMAAHALRALLLSSKLKVADDDVLSFLLSLDPQLAIEDLFDVFLVHVEGFESLSLKSKHEFVKQFRACRDAAPPGTTASGGDVPTNDVLEKGGCGRDNDDTSLEEISLEIPRDLLPSLEAIRVVLGDAFPIEVVIDALVRSRRDVVAAITLLLEEEESHLPRQEGENYANDVKAFDRLVGDLAGGRHGNATGIGAAGNKSLRPSQRDRFGSGDASAAARPAGLFALATAGGAKSKQQQRDVRAAPEQQLPPLTQSVLKLTHADVAAIASISAMFPELPPDQVAFAVQKHNGNADAAVDYIMGDAEFTTDYAIASCASVRAAPSSSSSRDDADRAYDVASFKSKILQRYDESADTSSKSYAPKIAWGSAPGGRKVQQQRFLDGQSVWLRSGVCMWWDSVVVAQ